MKKIDSNKLSLGYFVITIICIVIYSNTFNASWQLDDFPNIVENPLIRITDFSISSMVKASNLFHDQNYVGIPYRPAAFLSFAFNWYFSKDNVTGYHLVNIGIHILCGCLLYLLLLLLLKSPNLKDRFHYYGCEETYGNSINNVALLAAIFWAVHPIQIQAVTYIVQRMAALATLFYLLGMIFYVKARMNKKKLQSALLFLGCLCCLVLGILSKEIVLLLPVSLGLIEIIFFQDLTIRENRKKCYKIVIVILATTAVFTLLLASILEINFIKFINEGLEGRLFTLKERILTEPRIVIFYLSQIFYPVFSRFSIDHSITVSTSLFEPITTLAAILLIIGLIIIALFRIQKSPILSFAILFYFVNHIMESSIIPLELIFEHRNYLPSLFIFFPISEIAIQILNYYRKLSRQFMFLFTYLIVTVLIIVVGVTTYMRNDVWRSERTLWEDVLLKNPDLSRPYGRLAAYYIRNGEHNTGLELCEMSLSKKWARYSNITTTFLVIAEIYSLKKEYLKAISFYDKAFAIAPNDFKPMFYKANLLMKMERWDEAEQVVKNLLKQKYIPWDDFNLMGLILLKKNHPEKALDYFRRANKRLPHNPKVYVNIGISLDMMKYHQRAEWFFSQAAQIIPGDIVPLLCLIDNNVKTGDMESLQINVNNLFRQYSIDYIKDTLQQISKEEIYLPIDSKTLTFLIADNLKNYF